MTVQILVTSKWSERHCDRRGTSGGFWNIVHTLFIHLGVYYKDIHFISIYGTVPFCIFYACYILQENIF